MLDFLCAAFELHECHRHERAGGVRDHIDLSLAANPVDEVAEEAGVVASTEAPAVLEREDIAVGSVAAELAQTLPQLPSDVDRTARADITARHETVAAD